MKREFKHILCAVLALGTVVFVQSCNCEDVVNPDINWAQEHTNPVLTGVVNSVEGPVKNALITVDLNGDMREIKTDKDGIYTLADLIPGTFFASCDVMDTDKYSVKSNEVVLAEDKVTVWNVFLADYTQETFTITGKDQSLSIGLPYIAPEDESSAYTQFAYYYVEAGTLEPGDRLTLSSTYDYKRPILRSTKVSIPAGYVPTDDFVVVQVTSRSERNAMTTNKPITISVDGIAAPYLVVHNGRAVECEDYYDENGKLFSKFETSELGLTEFYFEVYKGDVKTSQVEIAFTPDEFKGRLETIEADYQYTAGTHIYYTDTFLDHYAAIIEGAATTRTVDAHLSLAKNVPAGETLLLRGHQQVQDYTYLCGIGKVSVKHYGSITLEYQDRMHTGGSN